jgi:signal peptidase I
MRAQPRPDADGPEDLSPPPGPAPEGDPRTGRRRRLPVIVEALIALVAIALLQAFVVKPFGVPSQSMENTLQIGDRIVVNRLDSTISRGDVVVFGHGDTWEQSRRSPADSLLKVVVRAVGDVTGMGPSNTNYTVKRVIGLPGDTVSCCSPDGKVLVNDEPLDEPYVFQDLPFEAGRQACDSGQPPARCFGEVVVPKDSYLVMGDHRSQSADSVIGCRGSTTANGCARFVDRSRVVGPVVFRLWPLSAVGSVD